MGDETCSPDQVLGHAHLKVGHFLEQQSTLSGIFRISEWWDDNTIRPYWLEMAEASVKTPPSQFSKFWFLDYSQPNLKFCSVL